MSVPDWVRMIDAHAAQGIAARPRTPEAVAARQATYETAPALPAIAALTFYADRGAAQRLIDLNRGRRAGTERTGRDIANDTFQDVMGVRHRPATHRKEK